MHTGSVEGGGGVELELQRVQSCGGWGQVHGLKRAQPREMCARQRGLVAGGNTETRARERRATDSTVPDTRKPIDPGISSVSVACGLNSFDVH